MMKVIISGAAGHMGRVVADCAAAADDVTVVAGLDQKSGDAGAFPIYADFDACTEDADVIIDFSHFSAFPKVIAFAEKRRLPLVIATTGLTDENEARIAEKAKLFPIFKTANMSLGINVIADVLQRISGLLTPGFDIEIVEKHHNRKVDAPSGTAILLADAVNAGIEADGGAPRRYTYGRSGRDCKRTPDELGIHAVRGGTIAGEHTVLYAGDDELIEIKHTALSRKIFGNGALTAARFLITKSNGLYDMSDVIGA
ncbi:dihydrodipicolinate reductase [Pseudoramibacter alactolyticus ATCC 23263]|uniref:4-hydroxy-tetrahydrodipicolinate reductase n=1 Tax=Pseudoramibacter alactolyticus ATCC 23263 TaxID=887929 RepID=E6MK29_9FIRM|nr:4-hydroxy-tetrahydrodipicolinate reductase [Pseudoramibacter alactolyticus]EFV00548.1 dihydrodipicolinate reductase [Pseudoramibacter alactolyticus ATCC 23263]